MIIFCGSQSEVWICMELMATCLDKLLKRTRRPIPEKILGKIVVAVSKFKNLFFLKLTILSRWHKNGPAVILYSYCDITLLAFKPLQSEQKNSCLTFVFRNKKHAGSLVVENVSPHLQRNTSLHHYSISSRGLYLFVSNIFCFGSFACSRETISSSFPCGKDLVTIFNLLWWEKQWKYDFYFSWLLFLTKF